MEEIQFVKDGPIGRLSLNRPDKLNAQTPAMWGYLGDLGEQLIADTDLRALIVDGPGRSFSAGIDITAFTGGGSAGQSTAGSAPAGLSDVDSIVYIQRAFTWLEQAPFLTIAKVQGHALGAGMQLALACDIRIVADDCQMGLLETRWGLMPDLGGTVWLPRLVGPAKALEMMVLAQRLNAVELLDAGIVNRVVARDDLDGAVEAFVEAVVRQPPLAVRGAKAAILAGWGMPTAVGMRAAAVAQVPCLKSHDFREAGAAFVEGRAAQFEGK